MNEDANNSSRQVRGNQRVKIAMRVSPFLAVFLTLISLCLPGCGKKEVETHEEQHTILVTSPLAKDVTITQPYVCQIHSQQHIDVQALANGFLEEIPIKEGQAVKKGDVLFKILPRLYLATLNAEKAEVEAATAEVKLAQIVYDQTRKLYEDKKPVVSAIQVALDLAKLKTAEGNLERAKAKQAKAQAELDFTSVTAQFDGFVDRLLKQKGSKIKEEDILTTLSDNSLMWVYFNVPEARYIEMKARYSSDERKAGLGKDGNVDQQARAQAFLAEFNRHEQIELMLADGSKFPEFGKLSAIEGQFNNKTGNIPFRADFPNPIRLLRHGQTGTVLLHRTLHNAIVIPQRATFEILEKRYVYVVGEDHVVHQHPIAIQAELDDIFIIKAPLTEDQIMQVLNKAKDLESDNLKLRDKTEREVDNQIGKEDRQAVQRAMQVAGTDEERLEAARKALNVKGLDPNDKIVLEGVRDVHDGEKLEEFEFVKPQEALKNQKSAAQ